VAKRREYKKGISKNLGSTKRRRKLGNRHILVSVVHMYVCRYVYVAKLIYEPKKLVNTQE